MSTVQEKLITAEEFARMPVPLDGSRQELVRGIVVMSPPPGFRHGARQVRVASLLDHYARTTKSGRVTVESGVVTEHDPDSVRGPDVAFWSVARIPLDREPEGYPEVVPDLCVEILSTRKALKKTIEKIAEYFASGVRMVWVIDPEDRTVTVYRSPNEGRMLHESAMLSGDEVLPGFRCKVSELFE